MDVGIFSVIFSPVRQDLCTEEELVDVHTHLSIYVNATAPSKPVVNRTRQYTSTERTRTLRWKQENIDETRPEDAT